MFVSCQLPSFSECECSKDIHCVKDQRCLFEHNPPEGFTCVKVI